MDLNDFENKYIDTIDSKYKIIEKIGRGYSSKVFKVKQQDINTEIFYAAKVFKVLENNKTKNNLSTEEMFEAEKEILNKLKNVESPSPYIINIIDSGSGKIIRTGRETTINNYIILDYAENGCLFDYIY